MMWKSIRKLENHLVLLKHARNFRTSSVCHGHKWYPDVEWAKQFGSSVMFPTDETNKYFKMYYNMNVKPVERQVTNMVINFGPQHPAAHGVLRLICELDGEIVVRADPHIGLLHRATEKLMENKHYNQSLPYMDRLDYVSTLSNEICFSSGVEKLLNIEVPPRGKAIRVICSEMMRIANHMLNVSGTILDAGGITPFFWMCEEREKIYEFCERLCGARVHCAYVRPGGVSQDLPIGWLDDFHEFCSKLNERFDNTEDLATTNRLFYVRMVGVGIINTYTAMSLNLAGPMLRATGVKWDLRISEPIDDYDLYDFDVVVGTYGDSYDRYLVRFEEMRQSLRIINQAMDTIPEGEYRTDDSKVCMPSRIEMKTNMESLIHHFKLCTEGYPVPPGATYSAYECPKGELGVYMVSDGTSQPYRVHLRSSSLVNIASLAVISPRLFLADVTIIIASVDVVFGDIDR